MNCLICKRIEMIKNNTNPYFVIELQTGYVVLGDHQHFKGYTLFLCKEHAKELHLTNPKFKLKFLEEMSLVGEAVYNCFKPEKVNYELLGNGDDGSGHIHWHIFPRVTGDTPERGPVWILPKEEMYNDSKRPTSDELEGMVSGLRDEINRLLKRRRG